jgi:hypothetical protein
MKKQSVTLGVRLDEQIAEVVKSKATKSNKTISKYIADKITMVEVNPVEKNVSINDTPNELKAALAGTAGMLTGLTTYKLLEYGLPKYFPKLTANQLKAICWTAAIAVGFLACYGTVKIMTNKRLT